MHTAIILKVHIVKVSDVLRSSPGKSARPVSISAMMQPTDQMSTARKKHVTSVKVADATAATVAAADITASNASAAAAAAAGFLLELLNFPKEKGVTEMVFIWGNKKCLEYFLIFTLQNCLKIV